jgi:hypothetical protein
VQPLNRRDVYTCAATNAGCASSHCKVQTHHSLFVKSTLRSTEPCAYHLCAIPRDASRRGLKHAYHPVLESRASRACRFLASAAGHSPMSPPFIPFARNYCVPHCLPPHFTPCMCTNFACTMFVHTRALGRSLPTLCLGHGAYRRWGIQVGIQCVCGVHKEEHPRPDNIGGAGERNV